MFAERGSAAAAAGRGRGGGGGGGAGGGPAGSACAGPGGDPGRSIAARGHVPGVPSYRAAAEVRRRTGRPERGGRGLCPRAFPAPSPLARARPPRAPWPLRPRDPGGAKGRCWSASANSGNKVHPESSSKPHPTSTTNLQPPGTSGVLSEPCKSKQVPSIFRASVCSFLCKIKSVVSTTGDCCVACVKLLRCKVTNWTLARSRCSVNARPGMISFSQVCSWGMKQEGAGSLLTHLPHTQPQSYRDLRLLPSNSCQGQKERRCCGPGCISSVFRRADPPGWALSGGSGKFLIWLEPSHSQAYAGNSAPGASFGPFSASLLYSITCVHLIDVLMHVCVFIALYVVY